MRGKEDAPTIIGGVADIPPECATWVASVVTKAQRAGLLFSSREVEEALVQAANDPKAVRAKGKDKRWATAQSLVEADLAKAARRTEGGEVIPIRADTKAADPGPSVEPSASREVALVTIRRVLKTKDPVGALVVLIWAAQAWLITLLESVFYLGFRGRSGAGKGTGVESALLLTPNGTLLSVVSPAFLAAALQEGRAIGIPEIDRLLVDNPIMAKMLRDGYRRGATYGLMVPTGDEDEPWTTEERSIFGPKVFDFHLSLDTHLLGRTTVVEMDVDRTVDRAMDAERKRVHLAPVKKWLEVESARALKEWPVEKVYAMWDDPKFRKEVESMGGSVGRDHVIAATMLLVCKVMAWDLEAEVRRTIRGRKSIDEWSDEAEVAEAIKALTGSSDKDPAYELPIEALLVHLNEQRTRRKLRPLSPRGLAALLADIGFVRDVDWTRAKAGPNRDKSILLPSNYLAQAAQAAQKMLDDPHRRDGEPVLDQNGPDGRDGRGGKGGIENNQETPDPETEAESWGERPNPRIPRAMAHEAEEQRRSLDQTDAAESALRNVFGKAGDLPINLPHLVAVIKSEGHPHEAVDRAVAHLHMVGALWHVDGDGPSHYRYKANGESKDGDR